MRTVGRPIVDPKRVAGMESLRCPSAFRSSNDALRIRGHEVRYADEGRRVARLSSRSRNPCASAALKTRTILLE